MPDGSSKSQALSTQYFQQTPDLQLDIRVQKAQFINIKTDTNDSLEKNFVDEEINSQSSQSQKSKKEQRSDQFEKGQYSTSEQIKQIQSKFQKIDDEIGSKIEDSSEDFVKADDHRESSKEEKEDSYSEISDQLKKGQTQLSKQMNQNIGYNEEAPENVGGGLDEGGYSDDNFESNENQQVKNESNESLEVPNDNKFMRKNTSKTNSAFVNQVVSDEPQFLKSIDDQEVQIQITQNGLFIDIQEENEVTVTGSGNVSSKQNQIIQKHPQLTLEEIKAQEQNQIYPLDDNFEMQRIKMEKTSQTSTEKTPSAKSNQFNQILEDCQKQPLYDSNQKRVLIRNDSDASERVVKQIQKTEQQSIFRSKTIKSDANSEESQEFPAVINLSIGSPDKTSPKAPQKNIERNICQMEIMPQPSPQKSRSSSKGTFRKQRTFSQQKSSLNVSKAAELLSDEGGQKLAKKERPVRSQTRILESNRNSFSNKKIKSSSSKKQQILKQYGELQKSEEVVISEDNSPITPFSQKSIPKNIESIKNFDGMENSSPNFGNNQINRDLEVLNENPIQNNISSFAITANPVTDQSQFFTQYHPTEQNQPNLFDSNKHLEVRSNEEFQQLIQAQQEEDMKVLKHMEKIESQKRLVNQQKIKESRQYQQNLIKLKQLEEEEKSLIWIKDPDSLKIINYDGVMQKRSRLANNRIQQSTGAQVTRASKNSKSSKSVINVDRSYQLIKDLKKKFNIGEEKENSQSQWDKDSSEQLINISVASGGRAQSINANKKSKIEKILRKTGGDKVSDQKKWEQIVKFMESNPEIMMELMPPTPKRAQNTSALHQEPCTNMVDDAPKRSRPSTSHIGKKTGQSSRIQSSSRYSSKQDESKSIKSQQLLKKQMSHQRKISESRNPTQSSIMQMRILQQHQFSQQMNDFIQQPVSFPTNSGSKSQIGGGKFPTNNLSEFSQDLPLLNDQSQKLPQSKNNVYLSQDMLNNSNSRVRFSDQQQFQENNFSDHKNMTVFNDNSRLTIPKSQPLELVDDNDQLNLKYNDGNFNDGHSYQVLEQNSNSRLRMTDSLKNDASVNINTSQMGFKQRNNTQSQFTVSDIIEQNTRPLTSDDFVGQMNDFQVPAFQQGILLNKNQSPQITRNQAKVAHSLKDSFSQQRVRSSQIYKNQYPRRDLSRFRPSMDFSNAGPGSVFSRGQGQLKSKQFVDMAITKMDENLSQQPLKYHQENYNNDQRVKQWPAIPERQSKSLLMNKGFGDQEFLELSDYNGFIERGGKPVDELINSNFRGHRLAKLMGIDNNSIAQKKLQQAKLLQQNLIQLSTKKQGPPRSPNQKKKRSPSPQDKKKSRSKSPKRSKEKNHQSRVKKLKMLRNKIKSKESVRSGGKANKKKLQLSKFEIVNQKSILDEEQSQINSGAQSPACSVCRQIMKKEKENEVKTLAQQPSLQNLLSKQNKDLEETQIKDEDLSIQRPISAAVPEHYKKKMPKKIHRETSANVTRKSAKHIESKALGKTGEHFGESDYENFRDGTSYTHTNNIKSTKIRVKETASQDNSNHELQRDFSKKTLQQTEGGSHLSQVNLIVTQGENIEEPDMDHHPKCPLSKESRMKSQKSLNVDLEQQDNLIQQSIENQSVPEAYSTLIVPTQNSINYNIREITSKQNDYEIDVILGIIDPVREAEKKEAQKQKIKTVNDLEVLRNQVFNRGGNLGKQDLKQDDQIEDETPRATYGEFAFDSNSKQFQNTNQSPEEGNAEVVKDGPHDWATTDVYIACRDCVPRFSRPIFMSDHRAIKIYTFITNMQNNAMGHQQAHILIPLFEFALDFLDHLLCLDMGLPQLFEKIKRIYNKISYHNTLSLLKRARIAYQLKDDARSLICRFLDLLSREKMINQLRDENVSDQLIQQQIDQLVKNGVFFMVGSNKFLQDYKKTFKEGKIIVNGLDTVGYAQKVLETHGVLQKHYKEYGFPV